MMNDEYEPNSRMIPPGLMAKSFLVIAGCYLLFIVFLFGTYLALAAVFFPEIFELLNEGPEAVKAASEADPESVWPRKLYWLWLATNSLLALMIGWTIGRIAPFGKFPHAVFLAILIFVSCLQQAIGAEQSIAWMFVLMMGALPIGVLYGASLAVNARSDKPDDPEEDDLDSFADQLKN